MGFTDGFGIFGNVVVIDYNKPEKKIVPQKRPDFLFHFFHKRLIFFERKC